MSTFVITANWTDQGVRAIKDVPKRTKAARDLAKKLGVEIKHAFLTTGESDLLLILDAPDGAMSQNLPRNKLAWKCANPHLQSLA